MQGRSGNHTGALSLSFIVETGPETPPGSARVMLSEGNFGSTPVRELLSGAWNEDGIQATELLLAVRSDLRVIEKEAEVALKPQERPAPLVVRFGIRLLVSSGIGAPILSLSEFCGLDSRVPSLLAPWCLARADACPWTGAVLLVAASALRRDFSAGVAFLP